MVKRLGKSLHHSVLGGKMNLFDAMSSGMSLTANGAVTNHSTLNTNLDLFSIVGSSRNQNLRPLFIKAFNENPELAIAILLWSGDIRGGAGERKTFKNLINEATRLADFSNTNIFEKVAELSRFDSLFAFIGTNLEKQMLNFYAETLMGDSPLAGLAAKWAPREKSANKDFANKLRKAMNLSKKEYRKLLAGKSNTVEQKMCSRDWDSIDFEKVPSVASARYQQAFSRNAPEKYSEYVKSLSTGDAKINAGAIFPHDVVKSLGNGNIDVANSQWSSLPNYLEGSDESILPVVDVSGSMYTPVGNSNTTCMDISIALGLYLSERLEGKFKDCFITFSSKPSLQKVSGDLYSRYNSMRYADWGMSTDIQATFQLILDAAEKHGLPQSELPSKVLILSDMEFDRCGSNTNLEAIRSKYERSGYEMPKLVFWNLNGRVGNSPAQVQDKNVALVSGFSPSIMTSLLGGEDFTPMGIMLNTVDKEKYKLKKLGG